MPSTDSDKLAKAQRKLNWTNEEIRPNVKKMDFGFMGKKQKNETDDMSGTCEICGGSSRNRASWDYLAVLPCSVICAKKKAWHNLCPELYRETDPEKLPDWEAYQQVMAWKYQSTGLLLVGPTGTGKTRSVYDLLHVLHSTENRIIRAFGATAFEDQCGMAYGNGNGPSWLGSVCRADIVFLDDLGKGVMTHRAEAGLLNLVEYRTSHCLPLLVTTNLTGTELKNITTENRGAPMVRRLREFCQIITF